MDVTYYSHTQEIPQKWTTAGAVVGGAAIWGLIPGGLVARLAMLGATALTATTFRSMTISVEEHSLNFHFGNGSLIKKSIPLTEIESAETLRTTPWQGWGIHYIGKGWLYNVYGLDAVDVLLKDGKHVFLGSDEPEALAAAINKHTTE